MRENFREADVVIKASVISLADTIHYGLYSNPIKPPFVYGFIPDLVVNKVYKGAIAKDTIRLIADYTSMCNYYFRVSKVYVIFLYKTEGKKYTTSVCARNFSLDDKEAVAEFNKFEK